MLLGVVKYYWGQTIFLATKARKLDVFQARLASVNEEGLNMPKIGAEYMCKYSGSLIGKHFKTIAQIMEFVAVGLVPESVIKAWRAIGHLVVLLWYTEITDLKTYIVSCFSPRIGDAYILLQENLESAIENVLNATAICSPGIITSKPKFHFLVHLPLYIKRFGPAIIFSTERYESFNSVFRLTCIHSNRQAPSRDSCQTFAYTDAVKHIATGGYWAETNEGRRSWTRAGSAIREYLESHPEHAALLAIPTVDKEIEIGKYVGLCGGGKIAYHVIGAANVPTSSFKDRDQTPATKWDLRPRNVVYVSPKHRTCPQNTASGTQWKKTQCARWMEGADAGRVHLATDVITASGDKAYLTSNVIYEHPETRKVSITLYNARSTLTVPAQKNIGTVEEILVSSQDAGMASHVLISEMKFQKASHAVYDIPCVEHAGTSVVVAPKVSATVILQSGSDATKQGVLCTVNLQHDCVNGKCDDFEEIPVTQERETTLRTRKVVLHKEYPHFVVNTNSLHNYRLIREVVPSDLQIPRPITSDVPALRSAAALSLQTKKKEQKDLQQAKKDFKEAAKNAGVQDVGHGVAKTAGVPDAGVDNEADDDAGVESEDGADDLGLEGADQSQIEGAGGPQIDVGDLSAAVEAAVGVRRGAGRGRKSSTQIRSVQPQGRGRGRGQDAGRGGRGGARGAGRGRGQVLNGGQGRGQGPARGGSRGQGGGRGRGGGGRGQGRGRGAGRRRGGEEDSDEDYEMGSVPAVPEVCTCKLVTSYGD